MICSRDSGGRVAFLPLGSPIMPVKSPIRNMDVVAEVLEVAQLVDQHGMAEVEVGRGRVEAGLDAQRAAGFQFFDQFGLDQQFVGAALDQRQLGVDLGHD
jgi:hypothetical protein